MMKLPGIRKRYGMVMDTRRCVGCQTCVIACKSENVVPLNGWRDWIVTETKGSFPDLAMEIRSERCMHCASAPCVGACPTGASHYNAGGTVLVDHDLCTGCKACIASCPYDARYVHPMGYVDKCTFCLHRVKEGKAPACVEGCPTKALAFGDITDPSSDVSRLLRENRHKVLKPEAGTDPNLFFIV
jgi:Fe-S-cluster-containing dehydrogenase component